MTQWQAKIASIQDQCDAISVAEYVDRLRDTNRKTRQRLIEKGLPESELPTPPDATATREIVEQEERTLEKITRAYDLRLMEEANEQYARRYEQPTDAIADEEPSTHHDVQPGESLTTPDTQPAH
ncbi:hypothetical protein [Pseudoxanthomonas mexicana]